MSTDVTHLPYVVEIMKRDSQGYYIRAAWWNNYLQYCNDNGMYGSAVFTNLEQHNARNGGGAHSIGFEDETAFTMFLLKFS